MSGNPSTKKILTDPPEVGDVVLLDLNPTRGDEKNKTRPCLIIQKKITPLHLVTVLPITDDNSHRNGLFFVVIPDYKKTGLTKKSVIDCYQIRTVSLNRIVKKMGVIDQELVDKIKESMALILGIHSYHIK